MKYLLLTCAAISMCFVGLVKAASNESNATTKTIPVTWSSGFTMPSLLASADVTLNNISDLPKLINAPWYAEIEVKKTKLGESVFSSCRDYFDKAGPSTRTKRDNEMSAYLEFKIMCEATRLLLNANNSKESFLPDNILNKDVAKFWPKQIALQTSAERAKRIAHNAKLRTWQDVTPIVNVEKNSKTKSTYFHNGGYQEVEMLGYGDANNDGVEDAFIVVRDYVEGGNYFNIRLFVLSLNAKGNWALIN